MLTDPGTEVTYTPVVDVHDYKAVSQRSLASGPAIITKLAVAFVIGNPFAGASLGSTMAGAGFSTLCSETAINMIEQGGDIGRSIQAMQKKNIVKTLARSVAAAGLTGTLGGSAASTSLESFAKEFLARAAVNTTLSIAFDGVKPGEALRQGALTAAVNTVGACIANQIGDMASSKMGVEQIGAVTHKLFHTFLGAGLGAATAGITGQDIGLGASSGAMGALVGETSAEFFDSKQLGDLVAATVAMASGLDVGIAYSASSNATMYNYSAHPKETEEEVKEYTQDEAREDFLGGAREGAMTPRTRAAKNALDEYNELYQKLDDVQREQHRSQGISAESCAANAYQGTERMLAENALAKFTTGQEITDYERGVISDFADLGIDKTKSGVATIAIMTAANVALKSVVTRAPLAARLIAGKTLPFKVSQAVTTAKTAAKLKSAQPRVKIKAAEMEDLLKRPLLQGEGKVGAFRGLDLMGKKGDNLTPNHMPQAAFMKAHGVKKSDGVAMMMEQPVPGTGGRHRVTRTYGKQPKLTAPPRQELALDLLDAKAIYKKDGVYTPEIRQGLLEVAKQNRQAFPEIFKKVKK